MEHRPWWCMHAVAPCAPLLGVLLMPQSGYRSDATSKFQMYTPVCDGPFSEWGFEVWSFISPEDLCALTLMDDSEHKMGATGVYIRCIPRLLFAPPHNI